VLLDVVQIRFAGDGITRFIGEAERARTAGSERVRIGAQNVIAIAALRGTTAGAATEIDVILAAFAVPLVCA